MATRASGVTENRYAAITMGVMSAPPDPPSPYAATESDPRSATSDASHLRGVVWLVAAAFFMQTLDSTIVNTAVPSIAHALSVRPIDQIGRAHV